MPYWDLHCDTLTEAFRQKAKDFFQLHTTMVTPKKLEQGDAMGQVFAIFMPDLERQPEDSEFLPDIDYITRLAHIFQQSVQNPEGPFHMVCGGGDVLQCQSNGKIAALLALEDGRVVQGQLERLTWLYQLGIRLITLTWNHKNCFGAPNSQNPTEMNTGLTSFGTDAVRFMEELGLLVDVSHLSDGGFWDVVRVSRKPFLASHSNCRALCPHPRNLTDAMIRAVADHGGVIGITLEPKFLTDPPESTLEGVVRHVQHAVRVGGRDCVALGSDFDGVSGALELSDASQMPRLFDALRNAGFSCDLCEAIAFRNAVRVLSGLPD